MCRSRGRARPARRSARPPFNGQLPLTPRAGHARPLPRGCHRLPGWVGVGELARRGGIYAARDICGGGNSAGRIYAAPTNRSEKWRLRLVCRGGIHASREPCAAANTPGGINPSPTHCPQTTACMAGRRGRRPLRRLARKQLPAATPRAGHCGVVSVGPRLSGAKPGSEQCLPPRGKQPHERASFAGWRRSLCAAKRPAPTTRRKTAAFLFVPPGTNSTIFIIYYFLFIICTIRGMIYLTPISITKRSDPF